MGLLLFMLPMILIVGLIFVFFREIIREHFQDIAARNLGIYGKLIFAVDAFFMFAVFCMIATWLCHAIWK